MLQAYFDGLPKTVRADNCVDNPGAIPCMLRESRKAWIVVPESRCVDRSNKMPKAGTKDSERKRSSEAHGSREK